MAELTFSSIEPVGFCEDDDNGKAAATSLLLSIGLFDLQGGAARDAVYEITSPVFDRVVIRLDKRYYTGGEFIIEAKNNKPENTYIQQASFNGKALDDPWVHHRDVVQGGKLVIELGARPNRQWGTQ